MRTFLTSHQIDKGTTRLETNSDFKEKELADWSRYLWIIDLPQADYESLGNAIAQLENTNPLLSIKKLRIHAATDDPEMQKVAFTDRRHHLQMKTLLYLGFVLCACVALADETPPIELKHKSFFLQYGSR